MNDSDWKALFFWLLVLCSIALFSFGARALFLNRDWFAGLFGLVSAGAVLYWLYFWRNNE